MDIHVSHPLNSCVDCLAFFFSCFLFFPHTLTHVRGREKRGTRVFGCHNFRAPTPVSRTTPHLVSSTSISDNTWTHIGQIHWMKTSGMTVVTDVNISLVESRSTLDQNTSWVYLRIPLVKIYSNKEFSQLPKFLRNEQVVPDSFRKFVRKFWKT
jgi:hypothetical protein